MNENESTLARNGVPTAHRPPVAPAAPEESWEEKFRDTPCPRLPKLPACIAQSEPGRIEAVAYRLRRGYLLRKGEKLTPWGVAALLGVFGMVVDQSDTEPPRMIKENSCLKAQSAWVGIPLLESLWEEERALVHQIVSLDFADRLVGAVGGDKQVWRDARSVFKRRLEARLIHQLLVMHALAFPDPERDWWLIADYRSKDEESATDPRSQIFIVSWGPLETH